MIKSNRVIKTTIFVVFLFVILSLPILNKSGVIFVQAYGQCTESNLNSELFKNDWGQICGILVGVHADENFYRVKGGHNVDLEVSADCKNLIDTYNTNITARTLSNAISKVCPTNNVKYTPTAQQETALKNLCNYCSDPKTYADDFHNKTPALAVPTAEEYRNQQAEVSSPEGTGEKTGATVSTEEDSCLLTDKNGALLNSDPSPCALESTWGWLNPLNSITGGIFYIIYLMLRGVLVVILKVFQWLLNPLNFGGYINFLNFKPSPSNPSLVPQLWSFIKNFANLGIILGMIFTAIATILRIEKYSWKKMLPKLLLIALLVNFSLIIAGIFVDISNYIINATLTSFNNISLSNLVVNCTLCPTVKAFYDLGGDWDLARATGLGIILSALFLFQFIGLVFYVFTRILTIVICLITSPFAFLTFAFPGGEKVWDFWRKQFQQAIVILPVLCLVFVLSLQFINITVSTLSKNIKPGDEGAFTIVLAYAGFVIVFAQLVRYVAKALGVEQVEKGFQMAKKAINTIAMAGVAAVGGIAIPKIMESKAFQKLGEGVAHVPLLRGVGQKMMIQGEINKKKRLEAYEKEMGQLSKGTLLKLTEQAPPNPLVDKIGYEKWQAATNVRADKGHGIAEENVDWIIRHSDDPGFNLKAISSTRPDLVKMNPDKTARQKLVKVNDDIDSAIASIAAHKTEDILKYMDGSAVLEHFENKGQLNEFSQKLITVFPQPSQIAAFWKSVDAKDKVPVAQGGKDYYAKFVAAIRLNTKALQTFKDALKYSKPLREDFRNI